MNKRLSRLTRIIAIAGGVLLPVILFFPIWRIELSAPQYPEGLVLQIFAHKLGGDVDVVNGLNHYIGMRTLHAKDFVEFQVLPYIIGLLGLFGLASVVINRRWFFYVWAGFFFLFAVTAMIDFYRWEYNYGHNLDPAAPIQVPGMSYQPPLIGYKQLLNFGAFSIPDTGGWILVAVGLGIASAVVYEWRKGRQAQKATRPVSLQMAALWIAALLLLVSCRQGPEPIEFGSDACAFCKMTITDKRFGGELVTPKGKVYKFDDTGCITAFMRDGQPEGEVYLVDFSNNGTLVRHSESILFRTEAVRGPMGGSVIAFGNKDSLHVFSSKHPGKKIVWNDLIQ